MNNSQKKALVSSLKEGSLYAFLEVYADTKKITRKELEILATKLAYILFEYISMSEETKARVIQATIDELASAGLFD